MFKRLLQVAEKPWRDPWTQPLPGLRIAKTKVSKLLTQSDNKARVGFLEDAEEALVIARRQLYDTAVVADAAIAAAAAAQAEVTSRAEANRAMREATAAHAEAVATEAGLVVAVDEARKLAACASDVHRSWLQHRRLEASSEVVSGGVLSGRTPGSASKVGRHKGRAPKVPAWVHKAELDQPYEHLSLMDQRAAAKLVLRGMHVLSNLARHRAALLALSKQRADSRPTDALPLPPPTPLQELNSTTTPLASAAVADTTTTTATAAVAAAPTTPSRAPGLTLRVEVMRVVAKPLKEKSSDKTSPETQHEQEAVMRLRWLGGRRKRKRSKDFSSTCGAEERHRLGRVRSLSSIWPNAYGDDDAMNNGSRFNFASVAKNNEETTTLATEWVSFAPGCGLTASAETDRRTAFFQVPNFETDDGTAADYPAPTTSQSGNSTAPKGGFSFLRPNAPWLELALQRGRTLRMADRHEARMQRFGIDGGGAVDNEGEEEDIDRWQLSSSDLWRCLLAGKPLTFSAVTATGTGADASIEKSGSAGGAARVTLLVTAEPEARTEARTMVTSLLADFLAQDLAAALPADPLKWCASVDPSSASGGVGAVTTTRKGKSSSSSVFTDLFPTCVKILVADLAHDEPESGAEGGNSSANRVWLTQQEVFCVVRYRGRVRAVAESAPAWKQTTLAQDLPLAARFGLLGGTPLPKPSGPLPFDTQRKGPNGEPPVALLRLPCPEYKSSDLEKDEATAGEGEDHEEDDPSVKSAKAQAAAKAVDELDDDDYNDKASQALVDPSTTLQSNGGPAAKSDGVVKTHGFVRKDKHAVSVAASVATPGSKAHTAMLMTSNMPDADAMGQVPESGSASVDPAQAHRQLVVEVWSRHPTGALFRGQVALGYSELERLTEVGYARYPLRRRPEDSARGVRIRLNFASPNPEYILKKDADESAEQSLRDKQEEEEEEAAMAAAENASSPGKSKGFKFGFAGRARGKAVASKDSKSKSKSKGSPPRNKGKSVGGGSFRSTRSNSNSSGSSSGGGLSSLLKQASRGSQLGGPVPKELVQVRTTLPSRSARTVPFDARVRSPPGTDAWQAVTDAAAAGAGPRLNEGVLRSAWAAEEAAKLANSASEQRAHKRGGGHETVDPHFGPPNGGSLGAVQEDVCRWDDAGDVPVEVPVRPLLRALGLSEYADVFQEAGLLTSRDLHATSDHDLIAIVVDYADRHEPPLVPFGSSGGGVGGAGGGAAAVASDKSPPSTAGGKSNNGANSRPSSGGAPPVGATVDEGDYALSADELEAIAAAAVKAGPQLEEKEVERLTLGHKPLLKLRTALHALGPRVHPGDNPTDLGEDAESGPHQQQEAEDDNESVKSAGSGASGTLRSNRKVTSSASAGSKRSQKGSPKQDKSGVLNLGELPHHDKRVRFFVFTILCFVSCFNLMKFICQALRVDVWCDLEHASQLAGTVKISAVRDPSDVAEPPAPAAHDFCLDAPLECTTSVLGYAPPLGLATLLAVFRDQAAAAPEQKDPATGHPALFWIPIYAENDEAQPASSSPTPPPMSTANEPLSAGGSLDGSSVSGSSASSASSSFRGEQRSSRPLRPHELMDQAAHSRRVLGMWVEVTKRTRPSTFPPKRNFTTAPAEVPANQGTPQKNHGSSSSANTTETRNSDAMVTNESVNNRPSPSSEDANITVKQPPSPQGPPPSLQVNDLGDSAWVEDPSSIKALVPEEVQRQRSGSDDMSTVSAGSQEPTSTAGAPASLTEEKTADLVSPPEDSEAPAEAPTTEEPVTAPVSAPPPPTAPPPVAEASGNSPERPSSPSHEHSHHHKSDKEQSKRHGMRARLRKLRAVVKSGLLHRDELARLDDAEVVEPLDVADATMAGIAKLLKDPMVRVRVTLTGLEYRVVEAKDSCVPPPSDDCLRNNPHAVLPVEAGDHAKHAGRVKFGTAAMESAENITAVNELVRLVRGEPLDSSAQLGLRAVIVSNPYRAASRLQNMYRGYRMRRKWLDMIAAGRKRSAIEKAREERRLQDLASDIAAAEEAKAAMMTTKAPSKSTQFKTRVVNSLKETVATAKAATAVAYAELQYAPRDAGRQELHRLSLREVERAERALQRALDRSMTPEELCNSALARYQHLDERVRHHHCDWGDLPSNLQYEADEVRSLLTRAAVNGYAGAWESLAFLHAGGLGVPGGASAAHAMDCYLKAAELGSVHAQFQYAVAAHNGNGRPLCLKTAAEWYGAAAEQDHVGAMVALGKLLFVGGGSRSNKSKSNSNNKKNGGLSSGGYLAANPKRAVALFKRAITIPPQGLTSSSPSEAVDTSAENPDDSAAVASSSAGVVVEGHLDEAKSGVLPPIPENGAAVATNSIDDEPWPLSKDQVEALYQLGRATAKGLGGLKKSATDARAYTVRAAKHGHEAAVQVCADELAAAEAARVAAAEAAAAAVREAEEAKRRGPNEDGTWPEKGWLEVVCDRGAPVTAAIEDLDATNKWAVLGALPENSRWRYLETCVYQPEPPEEEASHVPVVVQVAAGASVEETAAAVDAAKEALAKGEEDMSGMSNYQLDQLAKANRLAAGVRRFKIAFVRHTPAEPESSTDGNTSGGMLGMLGGRSSGSRFAQVKPRAEVLVPAPEEDGDDIGGAIGTASSSGGGNPQDAGVDSDDDDENHEGGEGFEPPPQVVVEYGWVSLQDLLNDVMLVRALTAAEIEADAIARDAAAAAAQAKAESALSGIPNSDEHGPGGDGNDDSSLEHDDSSTLKTSRSEQEEDQAEKDAKKAALRGPDSLDMLLPKAFGVPVQERAIFAHVCWVERVEKGRGRFGLGFLRRNDVTLKVVWGGRDIGTIRRSRAKFVGNEDDDENENDLRRVGPGLNGGGPMKPKVKRGGLMADWRLNPSDPNSPSSERFMLPIGIAALRPKVQKLKRRKRSDSDSSSGSGSDHESESGSDSEANSSIVASSMAEVSDDEGDGEGGGAPPTTMSDASPRSAGSNSPASTPHSSRRKRRIFRGGKGGGGGGGAPAGAVNDDHDHSDDNEWHDPHGSSEAVGDSWEAVVDPSTGFTNEFAEGEGYEHGNDHHNHHDNHYDENGNYDDAWEEKHGEELGEGHPEEDEEEEDSAKAEARALQAEVKASNAADELHLMIECFVDGNFAGQVLKICCSLSYCTCFCFTASCF